MSVTRRQLYVAAVLGAVAVVIAAPVLGQVLSGFIATSGTIPVQTNTDTTIKISGASDMAGTNFTNDNQVFIATDQGNITVTGNGQANATIAATDIQGTYTNVTSADVQNAVTFDPADKAKLKVQGGATSVAWRDYAVDSGNVGVTVDGSGTSDVTTYGLPGSTTVYAIDSSGKLVDVATTDSNGNATFTVDHSTTDASTQFANGELQQDFANSERNIKFVTTSPTTETPATWIADSGPTIDVTGTTSVDVTDPFPFSNTVDLDTSTGNIEFVSNGASNATVDAADITGTYTNLTAVDASTNAMTVDPSDKPQLTIDGAATDVAWTDYAPDDGVTDTVVTGPNATSSDLTYYGLAADSTFTAVNESTGTPLAVADTDGSGQVTFAIGHSTKSILLQSGDQSTTPTQSNASPTGDLQQDPSEFSVDVSDRDFPDDNVTVKILYEGSVQNTKTISSNSTVTANLPSAALTGGEHNWSVNATDNFANTNIKNYSYNLPNKLYIYNVTPDENGTHQLLDGANISVDVLFSGTQETVDIKTVDDGIVNLANVNPNEEYIVIVEVDGYHNRETYIENIYEQSSIFMLNESRSSSFNEISIDDRTGLYTDSTIIQIERVLNTSKVGQMENNNYEWVTVAGDRLGAGKVYRVQLENEGRYRFTIRNEEGNQRVLSEYTARSDAAITLEVGSVTYNFGEGEDSYEWTSSAQNETGNPSLKFAYNDYTNDTSEVTVAFQYRENGTEIFNQTFASGPYGEIVVTEPITNEQFNNHDFEVEWSAERGDDTIGATRVIGGQRLIGFGALDGAWVTAGFSLIALLIAFAVGSGISAGAGGLAVAGWMGVAWYIGAVPQELGAGAILLAFLVSAWTTVNEQQTEVIQ